MMEKYHGKINDVEIVIPYISDLKVKQYKKLQREDTMLEVFFELIPGEGSPEREAVEDMAIGEFREWLEEWAETPKGANPKG